MKIINEPFCPQRQRINWPAMFLPLYFAVVVGVAFYVVNSWRASADRAVDRVAQQLGVE